MLFICPGEMEPKWSNWVWDGSICSMGWLWPSNSRLATAILAHGDPSLYWSWRWLTVTTASLLACLPAYSMAYTYSKLTHHYYIRLHSALASALLHAFPWLDHDPIYSIPFVPFIRSFIPFSLHFAFALPSSLVSSSLDEHLMCARSLLAWFWFDVPLQWDHHCSHRASKRARKKKFVSNLEHC